MNDLDLLTDRLHEVGRRAPVPVADPNADLRRGRAALRRRHARGAAGVTAALVAVGAIGTIVPAFDSPVDGGGTAIAPAGPVSSRSEPSPAPTAESPCTITPSDSTVRARLSPSGTDLAVDSSHPSVVARMSAGENEPEVMAAQRAYQEAAAEILDPDGIHIDLASELNDIGTGGGSWTCDPATGPRLTGTGTRVGWESGDALGVIVIDVAPSDERGAPMMAESWTAYDGRLPAGVEEARVADDLPDTGGPGVVVERTDGLTVAVGAGAVWGNHMPPGSPPATDLPGVDRLLALAASPRLTFPGR